MSVRSILILLVVFSSTLLSVYADDRGMPLGLNRSLGINNQVLGALFDDRENYAIAEDMLQGGEPVVYNVQDWNLMDKSKVDLFGWDDRTIPNKLAKSKKSFLEFVENMKIQFSDIGKVKYRAKDLASLVGKLKLKNREGRFYPLSSAQDLYGFRLVFNTMDEVNNAVSSLERQFEVIDKDDYYDNPKDSGYRSVHLIIEENGTVIEGQVRTKGFEIWNEWSHDLLYKGSERVKELVGEDGYKDFVQYGGNLAEYIHAMETCEEASPPEIPDDLEVLWELSGEEIQKALLPTGTPKLEGIDSHCYVN